MKYQDLPIVYNESAQRFEMKVDNQIAFIDFKLKENKIFLIHTEVPEELEGKGVAAAMVEKAFIYIEQHQLKVVPACAYVKVFLERHPGWSSVVE